MAAAARPSEYGAMLGTVLAKLSALGEQCGDLPRLERDFENFSAEVDQVRRLLHRLGEALPTASVRLREAFAERAQDLKDDTDNFRDYVSHQAEMSPSRYRIERKDMGKELRKTIKVIREYLAKQGDPFGGTSSLRHNSRDPIVVTVYDEDLEPADTVPQAADD